jgi:hypothetical protein
MPSPKAGKTTTWNMIIFFSFWIALIIECYALYEKDYPLYTYSRIWVTPILLIRLLTSDARKQIDFYILFFYFFTLIADALILFGNYNMAYVGLSLFSFSYLSLGCYFNQIKQNHNKNNYIIGIVSAALIAINLLWIIAPELRSKVYYLQSAVHFCVISFLIYTVLSLGKRLKVQSVNKLFYSTVAIIVATNIIYAIDVLHLKRAFPVVDAIVGLGNGIYLYVFTKGVFAHLKRVA